MTRNIHMMRIGSSLWASPTDNESWLFPSPTVETASESSVLVWRIAARGSSMRKAARSRRDPDMADHYDFSTAERGKYAKRFAGGVKVTVLRSSRPIRIKCETLNRTEKS